MENYLIPPINSTGKFTLKDPLGDLLNPNIIYKVIAIRTLDEIIAADIDPYETIYKPLGLTEDDYTKDLENKIPIVILEDEANVKFNIPANRFASIPDITGIRLVDRVIAIDLGYTPIDEDLSYLIGEINDLITSMTGLVPSSEIIDTSQITVISTEDFNTYQQQRAINTNSKKTCRSRLKELEELVNSYRAKEIMLVDRLYKLENNS